MPALMSPQVPSGPLTFSLARQDWHEPAQALSQHNPPAQLPEVHWLLPLHELPLPSFRLHVLPSQK